MLIVTIALVVYGEKANDSVSWTTQQVQVTSVYQNNLMNGRWEWEDFSGTRETMADMEK